MPAKYLLPFLFCIDASTLLLDLRQVSEEFLEIALLLAWLPGITEMLRQTLL